MDTLTNDELYRQMASTLYAWQQCKKDGNTLWQENHAKTIKELIDKLPHGSGIDGTYWLNWKADPEKYIEFGCEHHFMNDGGYYDGWAAYTVRVYPHLFLGIRVSITGRFPRKYQDVKEWLYEIYG